MVTSIVGRAAPVAAVATTLALILAGCGGGGGGGDDPAVYGTCGSQAPSPVADCSHVDFGSCGNACCNLMLTVHESPEELISLLKVAVKEGAAHHDGTFTLQEMTDGKLGFDNLTQYAADLPEPFKGSKSVFIGQVHHTTMGNYTDTININMRNGTNGSSIVHAFSLSLVGGALGDNGQNYKNIMMLMSGLNYTVTEHLNNSCPLAAQLAQNAPNEHASPSRMLSSQDRKVYQKPAAILEAPISGTCGGKTPSPVADCQNVDFGSCGNACCSLLVHQAYEPARAMQKLMDKLGEGGPDGHYTWQNTSEGSFGFANLTKFVPSLPSPFNKSTSPNDKTPFWGLYAGQVHHMTAGVKHYNDTINFVIYKTDDEPGSYIRATSVSLVGGALGDNGQNYKNIIMAMDAAFAPFHIVKGHFFNSCPDPTAQVLV